MVLSMCAMLHKCKWRWEFIRPLHRKLLSAELLERSYLYMLSLYVTTYRALCVKWMPFSSKVRTIYMSLQTAWEYGIPGLQTGRTDFIIYLEKVWSVLEQVPGTVILPESIFLVLMLRLTWTLLLIRTDMNIAAHKDRLLLLCDRWQTSTQACTCC